MPSTVSNLPARPPRLRRRDTVECDGESGDWALRQGRHRRYGCDRRCCGYVTSLSMCMCMCVCVGVCAYVYVHVGLVCLCLVCLCAFPRACACVQVLCAYVCARPQMCARPQARMQACAFSQTRRGALRQSPLAPRSMLRDDSQLPAVDRLQSSSGSRGSARSTHASSPSLQSAGKRMFCSTVRVFQKPVATPLPQLQIQHH